MVKKASVSEKPERKKTHSGIQKTKKKGGSFGTVMSSTFSTIAQVIKSLQPWDWVMITCSIAQYIIADYLKKDDMIFMLESVKMDGYEFDDFPQAKAANAKANANANANAVAAEAENKATRLDAINKLIEMIDQGPVSQKYKLAVDFVDIADLEGLDKHFYFPPVLNFMRCYRYLQSAWKDYSDLIAHLLYYCIGADPENVNKTDKMSKSGFNIGQTTSKNMAQKVETLNFAVTKDANAIQSLEYKDINPKVAKKFIPMNLDFKTFIDLNIDGVVKQIKDESNVYFEYNELVGFVENHISDLGKKCKKGGTGNVIKEAKNAIKEAEDKLVKAKANTDAIYLKDEEAECREQGDLFRNVTSTQDLQEKLAALKEQAWNCVDFEINNKFASAKQENEFQVPYVIKSFLTEKCKSTLFDPHNKELNEIVKHNANLKDILNTMTAKLESNNVTAGNAKAVAVWKEAAEKRALIYALLDNIQFAQTYNNKAFYHPVLGMMSMFIRMYEEVTEVMIDTEFQKEISSYSDTINTKSVLLGFLRAAVYIPAWAGDLSSIVDTRAAIKNMGAFMATKGEAITQLTLKIAGKNKLLFPTLENKRQFIEKVGKNASRLLDVMLSAYTDLRQMGLSPKDAEKPKEQEKLVKIHKFFIQVIKVLDLIEKVFNPQNSKRRRDPYSNANAKNVITKIPYEIVSVKPIVTAEPFEFTTKDPGYFCFDNKGGPVVDTTTSHHGYISTVVTLRSSEKDVSKIVKTLAAQIKGKIPCNIIVSTVANQKEVKILSTGSESEKVESSKKSNDKEYDAAFDSYYETLIDKLIPPKTWTEKLKGAFKKGEDINKEVKLAIKNKLAMDKTTFREGLTTTLDSLSNMFEPIKDYFKKDDAVIYNIWLVVEAKPQPVKRVEYYSIVLTELGNGDCVYVKLVPNKGVSCTSPTTGVPKNNLLKTTVRVHRDYNGNVETVEWIWNGGKVHDITRFVNKEKSKGNGKLVFYYADEKPLYPPTEMQFVIPLLKPYQTA